jgi:hypothetical protein
MERQAILERMGWIFSRIRGTEFFRDADNAMKPVFEKLQILEIPPSADDPSSIVEPKDTHELMERVIRRSEEVRGAWSKSESSTSQTGTASDSEMNAR